MARRYRIYGAILALAASASGGAWLMRPTALRHLRGKAILAAALLVGVIMFLGSAPRDRLQWALGRRDWPDPPMIALLIPPAAVAVVGAFSQREALRWAGFTLCVVLAAFALCDAIYGLSRDPAP